jgi:thioredoxin 1
MHEVTDATFEAEVLASATPVVVDFWAPWCRPCKAASAALGELAGRHPGRVEVVALNVDEHPDAATRYGVLTLPTAILFEAGEARETVLGARSRSGYEHAFGAYIDAS